MPISNRDIEFLYEIGCLRFIPRTWKRFLNGDFANLAEHHVRVAWTSLIIAGHEHVTNTDKILKMALLHDIPESRTGDVDYLSRQYTQRDEDLGLRDMLTGTILREEMWALWEEYEARETIEAKIVKDADNLDVDFELQEQLTRGLQLGDDYFWRTTRQRIHDNKLYTDTAKAMWREMKHVDPHAWHINGRNRLNGGDWRT